MRRSTAETGRSARPGGKAIRRLVALPLIALGMIGATLAAAVHPAAAVTVVGTNVLYTTDADFDNGTLVNVNHDAPNSNQLQLNKSAGTFKFIWVALSQRCTIARIDTESGVILGEYRTVSDASSCQESSRTTVGLDGSVWVGHRGAPGQITHVGLAELNGCVDRNGNGAIETSAGYGDVKAWPGTNAPVSVAQDECILHHVSTGGGDSRHMSIDKDGNVWVGDRNSGSIFRKYNGNTAALMAGPLDFNCGGYGGLIDGNGVIWSATPGGSILRFDTTQAIDANNPKCLPFNNYGLAIDSMGNVWVSTLGDGVVRKFSPAGALLGTFPQGNPSAQGLAVDNNDHVWISSSLFCSSGCNISHLRNDGSLVGNVPTPTGSGSTGVSVDAEGKVWTANRESHTAVRIDPTAGPVIGGTPLGAVDLTVNFPAGPGGRPLPFPYNYSDMTGQQLFNSTAPQGSWTVVQDGGAAATEWGKVTWNTEPQGSVPAGTSLLVEARAAESEAGLGSASYVAVPNGVAFNMVGRFLQVRVTMKPDGDGVSPVLSDIRIESVPTITVSVNDVNVHEGDAGFTSANFAVTLSQPAGAGGVSVLASTANGSATTPGDYVARTSVPVTFAAGEQSKPFTVQVVGDLVNEPTETFLVNLSGATSASIADGQGVGTITDDERDGAFSCRASALRLGTTEPVVANPPDSPCRDAIRAAPTATVSTGGLVSLNVNAKTLDARTDQTPNDIETTAPVAGDSGLSKASVTSVTIVRGLTVISANVLQSQAKVECVVSANGGLVPQLTSSSSLASLSINGVPVNLNGSLTINLGVITIAVNERITTSNEVTQRALRVSTLGLPTLVVAESIADFTGNPCAQ
jgi:hypothetical protein